MQIRFELPQGYFVLHLFFFKTVGTRFFFFFPLVFDYLQSLYGARFPTSSPPAGYPTSAEG